MKGIISPLSLPHAQNTRHFFLITFRSELFVVRAIAPYAKVILLKVYIDALCFAAATALLVVQEKVR